MLQGSAFAQFCPQKDLRVFITHSAVPEKQKSSSFPFPFFPEPAFEDTSLGNDAMQVWIYCNCRFWPQVCKYRYHCPSFFRPNAWGCSKSTKRFPKRWFEQDFIRAVGIFSATRVYRIRSKVNTTWENKGTGSSSAVLARNQLICFYAPEPGLGTVPGYDRVETADCSFSYTPYTSLSMPPRLWCGNLRIYSM